MSSAPKAGSGPSMVAVGEALDSRSGIQPTAAAAVLDIVAPSCIKHSGRTPDEGPSRTVEMGRAHSVYGPFRRLGSIGLGMRQVQVRSSIESRCDGPFMATGSGSANFYATEKGHSLTGRYAAGFALCKWESTGRIPR